ncbi:prolipoprotein diacylglyceryl transferase [Corynebacterium choanae]|uniref:prolipoprotein diacylglyceryl transferase n=1 Tax=Corynebacterium choanae TaxID=1862358 RepID=UPI0019D0A703|nr:prolipoprotein diacylglyceryl transferase [Corynebacterium choanae]
MLLAALPSPPQGVWYFGPIPIRAYALCIIVGVIIAAGLTKYRYQKRGGLGEVVLDAVIVIVPAGIIGGRAYHVATDHEKYFCDGCNPWDVLKVTNGGLGIIGAVAFGVLCVWIMMRRKGLPLAPLADAAAPGIVLAQGIGRLGNWFNQELYGHPTNLPWALEIYQRVRPDGSLSTMYGHSTGQVIATVHPTFLYELVCNVLCCVVLIVLDRRLTLGHGRVFALYMAGYGLGRFVVESFRADPATLVFGLRINTITSALLVVAGLLLFALLRRGRETPLEVTPPTSRAVVQLRSRAESAAAAGAAAGRREGRPNDAGIGDGTP